MNLRLFLAITPPASVLNEVATIQAQAKETLSGRGFRWPTREKWHITLQFLGRVPSESVESLAGNLRAITPHQPFLMKLAAPGAFPSLRRPRVLWLGFGGEDTALHGLHSDVIQSTSSIIASGESRNFTPHLTLARIIEPLHPRQLRAVAEWAASTQPRDVSWTVEGFELWQSTLEPGGSKYARLASFPLGLALEAGSGS
jgi:2'-5' RNA ligase